MRNLTAALCLVVALLMGGAGLSWSADFQKGLEWRTVKLIKDKFKIPLIPNDAGLAGRGERPALQTADPDKVGPRDDGLDDVGATADRTIHHDLGTAGHGLNDLGQHMHGPAAVIEMPSAMI